MNRVTPITFSALAMLFGAGYAMAGAGAPVPPISGKQPSSRSPQVGSWMMPHAKRFGIRSQKMMMANCQRKWPVHLSPTSTRLTRTAITRFPSTSSKWVAKMDGSRKDRVVLCRPTKAALTSQRNRCFAKHWDFCAR